MNDTNQEVNLTEVNLTDSNNEISTDQIKKVLGIPDWVSNDIFEKAVADEMQDFINKLSARSDIFDKDKQFRLMMADEIWMKVKGIPVPDSYSEQDRLSIYDRYYHRAVAMSQGE